MNHGPRFDHRICDHTVRADRHPLPQTHLSSKHTVHIDADIMGAEQIAPHINTGRVRQAHAFFHQPVRLLQLVGALQLGQLYRAVDAGDLHRVSDLVPNNPNTIRHREFHDIGQVILLLGVAVVQARQPGLQPRSRHRHDSAVNLGDGALRFAGVFVLHDGLHRATGVAHNPAITGRVALLQRQQG